MQDKRSIPIMRHGWRGIVVDGEEGGEGKLENGDWRLKNEDWRLKNDDV